MAPITLDQEINFQETPAELSNATSVATAEEIAQLDLTINSVALSIVGEFQGRVETELLPLLYRMRSILAHGVWGKWYAAFCERHRIQWSIRTVQRKFKQLEDGWREEAPRDKSAIVQAASLLASAKEQLGKSAEGGCEQAKAHIARYEQDYTDAVEAASAQPLKATSEHKVNKRLASIVEAGERYIRVMERVYNDTTLTDRQRRDLDKAKESWRVVLRDARELSWAVHVIDRQGA
jgi:hypothetical protein